MTLQNAVNVMGDWKWQFLALKYNSAVETTTAWTLKKYQEINWQSMMVFVNTVEGTGAATMDVGLLASETGGDADGLIVGISIATAGWVRPGLTQAQGTQANYISAYTFGILFFPAAGRGANVTGQNAAPYFKNHIGDGTAKTISYTCATTSASFQGYLAFQTRQLPDPSQSAMQWPLL